MKLSLVSDLLALIVSFGVFLFALSLWIVVSLNGLATGHYFVIVDTNSIGEVELTFLLSSIPSIFCFFVRGLLRLFSLAKMGKTRTLTS